MVKFNSFDIYEDYFESKYTFEEIDSIYRFKEFQYEREDAKSILEEYKEDIDFEITERMLNDLVLEFEHRRDWNLPNKDVWYSVVEDFLEGMK